jgi:type IV secretion system protein VirD4
VASGKLHGEIGTPAGYIGELVATALRACGWQALSYNDLTQEITAEQKKIEKRSGMAWPFDYRLSAHWQAAGEKFKLTVEVQDREQHSIQRDCEQLCFDVIKGVVERAETLSEVLKRTPPKTTYGAARWAKDEDLVDAGYVVSEIEGNGLLLGPWSDGKKLVVPESGAIRHAVVCGPTGCGKTSSIFIPNLIERTHVSALVTEATAGSEPPDLYAKTAGYRASKGSKIYYFNPDDLTSTRINPVDQVKTYAKAQEIANLLMVNTATRKSTADPYWENSEKHLLTALLMHAYGEKGDLALIRRLLREGAKELGVVLSESKIAAVREEYQGFLRTSTENARNSVLSGLMQRLNLWVNPRIVALTEKSDFDPTQILKENFSFYLAVPVQKDDLKPLVALVFNFVLHALLEAHEEEIKTPLALFLDEFTNFGIIPGIANKLAVVRHRKIALMLGMQDYVQVRSAYGDDDATVLFSQPATRFIFRTTDLPTAKKTSESLGQQTVVDRKLSTSCQVTEKEFGKPLLAPSEVMALDPEESILFTPATPPLKLRRFSWKDYVEQTAIKPPYRCELRIDEQLVSALEKEAQPPNWETQSKMVDNDTKSSVVKDKDSKWKPKEVRVTNDDDETLPI